MKFLVINGVNLNLTGKREKGVYGTDTLEQINEKIAAYCHANGDGVDFYQSNIEGEIVEKIKEDDIIERLLREIRAIKDR